MGEMAEMADYFFESMDIDHDYNTGEAGPSPFGGCHLACGPGWNSKGYFGFNRITKMTDDHLSKAIYCLNGQFGMRAKQEELKAEQVRREFGCL